MRNPFHRHQYRWHQRFDDPTWITSLVCECGHVKWTSRSLLDETYRNRLWLAMITNEITAPEYFLAPIGLPPDPGL